MTAGNHPTVLPQPGERGVMTPTCLPPVAGEREDSDQLPFPPEEFGGTPPDMSSDRNCSLYAAPAKAPGASSAGGHQEVVSGLQGHAQCPGGVPQRKGLALNT